MSPIKIRSPFIIVSILIALLLVTTLTVMSSVQARPYNQEGLLADPEEIAPHGAFGLALGGGTLGWTYLVGEFCSPPGTIGAIDLTTREDDVLLERCGASPANAVADDNFLYFADWGYDEVQRISFTTGVTRTLADAAGLIYHRGLTIDADFVYFGDEAGIHRVRKTGGSVEDLSPNTNTSAMAVDDAYLYWTEGAIGGGAIRRMLKEGGAEETLRDVGLDNPGSITVDEAYVYWTELGSGMARRLAKDGTGEILDYVPEQPSYGAGAIAVNDAFVFWADSAGGADGRIRRAPKGGGTVEDIALGQFGPGGIQLSATHVYWYNYYGIYRLPLDTEGVAVDLTIARMEITQGIQNSANEVAMVQGKSTFVRAFPAVDIANTADVTAVLHGFSADGSPLPGSPLTPISPLVYVQVSGALRRNLNQSFNFWLPSSWRSGNVTLRAEINPNGTINESDVDNNTFSLARNFSSEAPVCMVMIPVHTHGSRYTVYSDGFWDVIDRFESLWPVPEARVYYQSSSVEELQVCFAGPFPYPCFGPYELPDDGWKVITSLIARDAFTDDPDECDSDNARTHYVGMVSPDTDTDTQTGYANYVFAASYVKMEHDPVTPAFSSPDGGATMAQELSHNYNGLLGDRWLHVDCGGPDGINPNYPYPTNQIANLGDDSHWGFDRFSMSLIEPDDARDYMSYCSPKWVSDYTWTGMMGEIGNLPLAGELPAVPPLSLDLGPQAEVLYVSGVITPTAGTATFDYSYRLDEGMINPNKIYSLQQAQETPEGPAQNYAIELVGPGGVVLLSQPFTPTPPFEGDPAQVFVLTMPYDATTEIIRLVEDGTVLHQVEVSPNPPMVTVLQPNGGENVTDQLTIEWEASDPDEDTLLYTVEYSPDDGATWQVIQTNYFTTTLTLTDTLGLPASEQARVRVIAWDGVNTAADISDAPFSVANHQPVAHISTPEDGDSVKAGNQLILSGRGFDIEDGTLGDASLEWLLDDSSVVGTGTEISLEGLSPGLHTITLRASDAQGAQDETSIQILVYTQLIYMPVIQR